MFPGPVNRLKHYARIYMQRQEVLRQRPNFLVHGCTVSFAEDGFSAGGNGPGLITSHHAHASALSLFLSLPTSLKGELQEKKQWVALFCGEKNVLLSP